MHKQRLLAVLTLGLLLLTGNAFAAQDEDVFARVQSPALDKSGVALVERGVEPLTAIQGGTPRVVPGTFCTVDATGGFTGWYYLNMIWQGETYVSFNDVDLHSPACAGLPNNYTFDVTATNCIACNDYPGATYSLQPVVYDADLSNPACPFPGPLLCAGPVYLFVLPLDICYDLNMAFDVECCVTGPYFAGFFCPAQDFNLGLAVDYGGAVPPLQCQTYNNYFGPPWVDLYDWGVEGNFLISSEGLTPDHIITHCTPGVCEYQWYYPGTAPGSAEGGWDQYYGLRSDQYGSRDKLGVRFKAIGLDTLKGVNFMLDGAGTSDPAPDILVEVWEDGGHLSPCWLPTPAGGPIWSTVVAGDALVFYPAYNTVTIPDLIFGHLNGCPIEYFFITITTTQASHDLGLSTGLAAYGPCCYTTGCQNKMNSIAFYSVYDIPADDPTGDLGPTWVYTGERNWPDGNQHAEFVMEATICAELLSMTQADCDRRECAADDWPTWSHDYQHTGASDIPVGDPNGITLEWSVNLGADMSFNNPTVAGDVVYASSADRVEGFDLATGTPIPGSPFTGIPEMGTNNRGNTTIHNGVVYITGGNFAALSALPVGDLRKSSMLWSNNAMTMADMSEQNRFGCAMVIDDLDGMGTDVVFVLTESIHGFPGELYAFDAATGMLYGGWGTNPVLLDKPARHGPSYDGTWLYVGTADMDLTDGSIYAFDPHTGSVKWQFHDDTYDPAHPGGFPGGVSIEGDYLYAASSDAVGNGRRFMIDISGPEPVVIWMHPQSRALYGAPTIGRNFLFIPQDNAPGVLMVFKETGDVIHNFALNGVGLVPQNIALSCDNYLFVGDRNARWWVLNANMGEAEFYRQYPVPNVGIVNGTALASDDAGNHYAVVGIRWDGTSGRVSAYRFGTGSRPRLRQDVAGTSIDVPLDAGPGLTHAIPDAFSSIGDEDVIFESVTIADPDPDPIIKLELAARRLLDDDRYSTIPAGADHWTHFSRDRITKDMRVAGVGGPMTEDGEFTRYTYDRFIKPLEEAQATSGRAQIRSAAVTAALTRTANVTIGGSALPTILQPGSYADLAWEYDGTDLGRGTDIEIIRITVNDPDFDYTIGSSVAEFEITYVGGCPRQVDTLQWYAGSELVCNDGGLGDQGNPDNLIWNADPASPLGTNPYDGGFFVVADEPIVRRTFFSVRNEFLPDLTPTGDCGFEEYHDVPLGTYRNGGIPGTPVTITGDVIVSSYVDTNRSAEPGTPEAAIGLDITQTEIGAHDALYGDFKLIRWEMRERNGNTLTDLHAGSFIDWDVRPDYSTNLAALWPHTVNGYAIWDDNTPSYAYGMLDPHQYAVYINVDPTAHPVHGIAGLDHNGYDLNPGSPADFWDAVVNIAPTFRNDGIGDRSVMLTHQAFDIPPYGTTAIHQALYAMPALNGSADEALMETQAMNIAARAARWGGFARGDVNDDGRVDLGDVLWLVLGYPIYPDDYCGDVNIDGIVDQADIDQLMAWVSGDLTAQPLGEWRFEF